MESATVYKYSMSVKGEEYMSAELKIDAKKVSVEFRPRNELPIILAGEIIYDTKNHKVARFSIADDEPIINPDDGSPAAIYFDIIIIDVPSITNIFNQGKFACKANKYFNCIMTLNEDANDELNSGNLFEKVRSWNNARMIDVANLVYED